MAAGPAPRSAVEAGVVQGEPISSGPHISAIQPAAARWGRTGIGALRSRPPATIIAMPITAPLQAPQQHQRQHLPAHPRPERGQQLEIAVAHALPLPVSSLKAQYTDHSTEVAGDRLRSTDQGSTGIDSDGPGARATLASRPSHISGSVIASGSSWWSRSIIASATSDQVTSSAATAVQSQP